MADLLKNIYTVPLQGSPLNGPGRVICRIGDAFPIYAQLTNPDGSFTDLTGASVYFYTAYAGSAVTSGGSVPVVRDEIGLVQPSIGTADTRAEWTLRSYFRVRRGSELLTFGPLLIKVEAF